CCGSAASCLLPAFPTRRSSALSETFSGTTGADILLDGAGSDVLIGGSGADVFVLDYDGVSDTIADFDPAMDRLDLSGWTLLRSRSEEHTSELQSRENVVCRLLL